MFRHICQIGENYCEIVCEIMFAKISPSSSLPVSVFLTHFFLGFWINDRTEMILLWIL